MTEDPWRPSCSRRTLQIRAAMLKAIRQFFEQHGYLEVETPCLSRDIVIDSWLDPIEVTMGRERWFLQTSPEAFMKRLLAAGSGSIFQISRVFRGGEIGVRHNPEFTMVEWYGVGTTWQEQIALTESLVRTAVEAVVPGSEGGSTPEWLARPFRRTTYAEAFSRIFGIDVHSADCEALLRIASESSIPLPDGIASADAPSSISSPSFKDDVLNAMLAFAVEPTLGRTSAGDVAPEFLCDYPATQAALAVTSSSEPLVARRFELYINALELCNGYQELTDCEELQRRDSRQNAVRGSADRQSLPGAKRLLSAMQHGLPECAGVALGFDRLMMITTGASQIADILPFPVHLS